MINAVYIEDETRNIDVFKMLISEHLSDKINIVGFAKNVQDATALINRLQPELVYLDIELNDGNAFELLAQFPTPSFQIIFTTAFNEYAIKAFRMNAVDYLLKPICSDELIDATEKAIEKISNNYSKNNILDLLQQLKQPIKTAKIGLPVNDGIVFINSEEIIKAEAKSTCTVITLVGKKSITTSKNLKDIQILLSQDSFVRVHNSWLINSKFMKKYFRGKNGYLELEDGSTIPVSQRKKGEFLDFFDE